MSRKTIRRRLLIILPIAAIALFIASLVPFVRPIEDHPTRADAVVVLSGDRGERLALGMRMIRAGVAPTLVLAGRPDTKAVERMCHGGSPFEVVCLRPDPDSTRNEARATAELAASRGWRTIVVATSTVHVTRSRMLFGRCVDGSVSVAGATPPYGRRFWARAVAHEWLGTVHALIVKRGC